MNPEKKLARIQARAVKTVLHPLLTAALPELDAGRVPPSLSFLAELARATLAYKKGSREQRRELRRIVMQPAISDAEFLSELITAYLTAPGPSCPGLYD